MTKRCDESLPLADLWRFPIRSRRRGHRRSPTGLAGDDPTVAYGAVVDSGTPVPTAFTRPCTAGRGHCGKQCRNRSSFWTLRLLGRLLAGRQPRPGLGRVVALAVMGAGRGSLAHVTEHVAPVATGVAAPCTLDSFHGEPSKCVRNGVIKAVRASTVRSTSIQTLLFPSSAMFCFGTPQSRQAAWGYVGHRITRRSSGAMPWSTNRPCQCALSATSFVARPKNRPDVQIAASRSLSTP